VAGPLDEKGRLADTRVEPEVGSGYVVAYRRDLTEAHRHARALSPSVQAKFERESSREKVINAGDLKP